MYHQVQLGGILYLHCCVEGLCITRFNWQGDTSHVHICTWVYLNSGVVGYVTPGSIGGVGVHLILLYLHSGAIGLCNTRVN